MHYGDDWGRVAQHVGGRSRSEREFVAHFSQLPFREQFVHYQDSGVSDDRGNQLKQHADAECVLETVGSAEPSKRMRITPLADASNPIMAQAAFLSALAGLVVMQAAAQAALTSPSKVYEATRTYNRSLPTNTLLQGHSDFKTSLFILRTWTCYLRKNASSSWIK